MLLGFGNDPWPIYFGNKVVLVESITCVRITIHFNGFRTHNCNSINQILQQYLYHNIFLAVLINK